MLFDLFEGESTVVWKHKNNVLKVGDIRYGSLIKRESVYVWCVFVSRFIFQYTTISWLFIIIIICISISFIIICNCNLYNYFFVTHFNLSLQEFVRTTTCTGRLTFSSSENRESSLRYEIWIKKELHIHV